MKKFDISKGYGTVFWSTGLPRSGKTTLAKNLDKKLQEKNYFTELIDGDQIRKLWPQIGFSHEDRIQNILRVAYLARHYARKTITIVALISPYKNARKTARKTIEECGHQFIEIFVNCPLDVCEARDIKGMYKLARQGLIQDFTGVSGTRAARYEKPQNPDIMLLTDQLTEQECLNIILSKIKF